MTTKLNLIENVRTPSNRLKIAAKDLVDLIATANAHLLFGEANTRLKDEGNNLRIDVQGKAANGCRNIQIQIADVSFAGILLEDALGDGMDLVSAAGKLLAQPIIDEIKNALKLSIDDQHMYSVSK